MIIFIPKKLLQYLSAYYCLRSTIKLLALPNWVWGSLPSRFSTRFSFTYSAHHWLVIASACILIASAFAFSVSIVCCAWYFTFSRVFFSASASCSALTLFSIACSNHWENAMLSSSLVLLQYILLWLLWLLLGLKDWQFYRRQYLIVLW